MSNQDFNFAGGGVEGHAEQTRPKPEAELDKRLREYRVSQTSRYQSRPASNLYNQDAQSAKNATNWAVGMSAKDAAPNDFAGGRAESGKLPLAIAVGEKSQLLTVLIPTVEVSTVASAIGNIGELNRETDRCCCRPASKSFVRNRHATRRACINTASMLPRTVTRSWLGASIAECPITFAGGGVYLSGILYQISLAPLPAIQSKA